MPVILLSTWEKKSDQTAEVRTHTLKYNIIYIHTYIHIQLLNNYVDYTYAKAAKKNSGY